MSVAEQRANERINLFMEHGATWIDHHQYGVFAILMESYNKYLMYTYGYNK